MLEKEQAHGKGRKDCNPTPMIQICIEPMEGQRFTLDVKASETILDVKAMIQARVDAMFQNSNVVELIFLDMPMFTGPYVGHGNEPRTLEHYDIEEGTVIKVRWTAIQTHPHSEKELVQKKGEDKHSKQVLALQQKVATIPGKSMTEILESLESDSDDDSGTSSIASHKYAGDPPGARVFDLRHVTTKWEVQAVFRENFGHGNLETSYKMSRDALLARPDHAVFLVKGYTYRETDRRQAAGRTNIKDLVEQYLRANGYAVVDSHMHVKDGSQALFGEPVIYEFRLACDDQHMAEKHTVRARESLRTLDNTSAM